MSDSDKADPALLKARETIVSRQPNRIGRYAIERVLGEGSFGVVYLARDDDLQRAVAIKVPTPRLLVRSGAADAFLCEARIVAALRHEHIVRVFDFGRTDDGACFIVSEYIEGGSLADLLKNRRPGISEAVVLVAGMAEALHHAHQHRLVHRDVKPGNILLDTAGHAYLVDFGIALRDEDFGSGSGLAGTPVYMSPEQARGEGHRVDGRADVYSLGAVLYKLLTGQVPFRRDRVQDLLEDIASLTLEARPPRQLVTDLPRELERICLKALAKRAAERYSTAHDFADDLRALLAQQPPLPAPSVLVAAAETPPVTPGRLSAFDSTGGATPEERLRRVIPRGLRAFDAEDREFFLELLPGPRDRHGLPDSIRFWKRRIEATDPEQTFAVGLLYGPSGCGKSSLVRAGLLPRLGRDVVAIYGEAAAGQTEARLLRGLARHCPGLDTSRGLAETLTALRRGEGPPAGGKVLLVLDQFEQFLHAHGQEGDTELVRALRQCDGVRVQALLLVRDDFWLAVTRFLAGLEVDLVQGHNTAVVDLFDPVHARKVLAAFGHAQGRLVANPGQWSREQQAFLDQAVAGLARAGRVIPVRLALFAEMVKGKPWERATLRAVGGTEGVGLTFLEESFAAPSANPRHRLHQKAVRGVLRALLPERGTDIKGSMRSVAELESAAGYAGRPKEFADLMHVLDGDLRLVTPTDPAGAEEQGEPGSVSPRSSDARYFQLTHDYLVPAVRTWLRRKQRESWRGRAEIRLEDRATLWQSKRENRHLPAWWEWLNIRLLTRKQDWTEPQRKMMRTAGRYQALRAFVVAVLLFLLGWGGYEVHGRLQAYALRRGLLEAKTLEVPAIVRDIAPYRRWLNPLLQDAWAQAAKDNDRGKQLHASLALLPVDATQVEYLFGRLLDAEPQEVLVIREALAPHQAELLERLWAAVEKPDKGKEPQRLRAAAALASYDPEGPRWEGASGKVVEDLVGVNSIHLGVWSEAFRGVKARLLAPLAAVFRDGNPERSAERTLATNLLADYAADQPHVLADLLMDADDKQQFAVLYPKFADRSERGLPILAAEIDRTLPPEMPSSDERREKLAKRQANAAVALLRMDQAEKVWPLLKHSPDPRVRSYLIHRLSPLGADPKALIRRLDEEPDVSVRRAVLLSLGEFGAEQLPAADREALIPRVLQLYRDDPDPGLHGAAEWLLRQWNQDRKIKAIDQDWAKDNKHREERLEHIELELFQDRSKTRLHWYVNGQGQTMVVIPGPVEFLMGSPPTEAGRVGGPEERSEIRHKRRIGHAFALAAREVTVEQFLRFRKDQDYYKEYSPTPDCPVNIVTWYDAAAYCNWLSKQEGLDKDQWCYLPNDRDEYAEGMKLAPDYLKRTGYRLPSEAEWEYACRAGAVTGRAYGETEELLGKYVWYTKNSKARAMLPGLPGYLGVRGNCLKPNDFGLFDMLGNALEWCQDSLEYYTPGEEGKPSEDSEDKQDITDNRKRVLRGGSFVFHSGIVRCASRFWFLPTHRSLIVGFRPARTVR